MAQSTALISKVLHDIESFFGVTISNFEVTEFVVRKCEIVNRI